MYPINKICVCGAGTMGSGIAQVAARAGIDTIQYDVNTAMLEKSRDLIQKNLHWLIEKSKISEQAATSCLERILFTNRIEDCMADVFIEAIIEQKEAKLGLFNQLAAIFATNTSSLSVTSMAQDFQRPSHLLGMHFFNPAPQMKLVELVSTTYTNSEVLATLISLAEKMNKVPVVCKDAPGFIVNRVARQYYLEAMHLLKTTHATVEEIDAIMEASGFKMGPFKLMDLIGMDINFSVSNIVWEALGKPERLRPSSIQQEKVAAGELGRKTGKGFYVYADKNK
jgi:3-hydroxybutyryl-CoA dehydrogenase